ncbi:receptor activity-modifying protein 2 isoform X2 [Pimephales promelas]|uniref:receptor activity-modifying protein 2 isoform X2 n=1 Tax=Pimephales promelas TaxID=90988 RepID=UPI001955CF03|nr:receptor activity-modifying protein 2 isoform X2 [Pimephales promelas]KAG1968393.1 receptor activity-modifying protein [Pimephales promelas]
MALMSIASKPHGTLLFLVCLYLMVSTLQTQRPTASTLPTELQTTAYTRADPGLGDGGTFGCANMSICEAYCSLCVNSSLKTQGCYEVLVHICTYHFNASMGSINSTDWCSLERVKSAYNNFTVCTEIAAECLLIPWPNTFVENMFVVIHTAYFQECPTEALRDPPPGIILALVMTPICLIPAMVVLVVLKTKNGDRRS